MKYLLDTDHISILQRRSGPEFGKLWSRIRRESRVDSVSPSSAFMNRFWAVTLT